ncbi:hypothetical protein [Falsiroseomonas oryzae]|uniref:hypothetical protein n=1 Tax=Falsiroseomonas oryzae TaxID=2766473 RepID=UPI0022EAAE9F|nr:hypothetical protein [Roseomonas sp. MO-31]
MAEPAEIARIDRDIAFQRHVWRLQRVAWLAMAALVVAACLGLFGGGGPFADQDRQIGDVQASWARMQRLGRTDPIRLDLPSRGGDADVRLAGDFPRLWRLHDTTPPPLSTGTAGAGLVLRFGRDADGVARIALHAEPIGAPGPRRLRIVADGQSLDLPVLVWP